MRRLVMIAGLVLASIALGGRGEGSAPQPPGNELTRLIDRVTVGRPYTTRNLAVFPLYVSGETDATRYVKLDEAIKRGKLKVCEKGEGRVQEVLVQNTSGRYVFLMAGEIISGAKQNRVITTDTLLRPEGPEVAVPVYCVERGRWTGKTMAFDSGKSFAGGRLRNKAQSKAGQDKVWTEVEKIAADAGVNSETSDLQEVVEDKEVGKVLNEYDTCMPTPPSGCVGAALVINNRIVGIELFANETLFAALWPKVRRGYALDAYRIWGNWERMKPPPRLINAHDVRVFLGHVHRAKFTTRNGVDLGELWAIGGKWIAGEGLVFEGRVVHVNFSADTSGKIRMEIQGGSQPQSLSARDTRTVSSAVFRSWILRWTTIPAGTSPKSTSSIAASLASRGRSWSVTTSCACSCRTKTARTPTVSTATFAHRPVIRLPLLTLRPSRIASGDQNSPSYRHSGQPTHKHRPCPVPPTCRRDRLRLYTSDHLRIGHVLRRLDLFAPARQELQSLTCLCRGTRLRILAQHLVKEYLSVCLSSKILVCARQQEHVRRIWAVAGIPPNEPLEDLGRFGVPFLSE